LHVSFIRQSDEGQVRRITLARPDLHNAFDDRLIADLTAAFREASAADSVRVVVLSGEGKSFCAGADLAWMGRMVAYSRGDNFDDSMRLAGLFEAVDACSKPVVARVHGAAIGGGVGLVACSDIAIASSRAVFALSEVRLGLAPAVISPYVIGRIGVSSARRYFLTGEHFGAADALRVGLVSEVVDAAGGDEALDAAVERVVSALLRSGPEAVERCKQLIRAVPDLPTSERAVYTAGVIADLRVGAQGQEGMRAFLEKRDPAWVGSEDA
jgi:methylglutaconyl-CoA hydratase